MRILIENVNCHRYFTFISMQKQTLNHCNFLYANFIKKNSPGREIWPGWGFVRKRKCRTDDDVEHRDVALTHSAAADVLILPELVFALSRDCVWWMSSYGSVWTCTRQWPPRASLDRRFKTQCLCRIKTVQTQIGVTSKLRTIIEKSTRPMQAEDGIVP